MSSAARHPRNRTGKEQGRRGVCSRAGAGLLAVRIGIGGKDLGQVFIRQAVAEIVLEKGPGVLLDIDLGKISG